MTWPAGHQPGPSNGPSTRREGSRVGATDTDPPSRTHKGGGRHTGGTQTHHTQTHGQPRSQGGEEAGGSATAPSKPAAARDPTEADHGHQPAEAVVDSQAVVSRGAPEVDRCTQPAGCRSQENKTERPGHRSTGARLPLTPPDAPPTQNTPGTKTGQDPPWVDPRPRPGSASRAAQSEDGRGSTRASRTQPHKT